MAKTISASEADFSRVRTAGGGTSWIDQDWLNGEVWVLEPEVDFKGKAETARTRLYSEANALQKGARVKLLGDGNILFQAYDKTPDQLAAQQAASEKRAATRAANIASGKVSPKKAKAAEAF